MKQPLALLAALLLAPLAAQAQVPQSLDELWADFPRLDQLTPLETEILKEWTQDGVACRIVRFQVGVFQGAPARVAAFYAFPEQGTKLPALLSLHGGGQSASLDGVLADAQRGYAALSLNWGGNKLNFGRSPLTYDGPQTDWGRLDATHPPQRNKAHNHFAGSLTPDEFTLDRVESPRNSNWFVVLMAARRAVTFLEQQPEVDPGRIGVYGHSMGGKLTTNLAGIDPRIKAAVPSCGGGGDVLESQTELPGCLKNHAYRVGTGLHLRQRLHPAHHLPDAVAVADQRLPRPDRQHGLELAESAGRADAVQHLTAPESPPRGRAPHHPASVVRAASERRLPDASHPAAGTESADAATACRAVSVTPDDSQPVQRVDIYYSTDPHELTRFWRDALAVQDGTRWRRPAR